MNAISTPVNNFQILSAEVRARPLSTMACIGFLSTGLLFGHAGIEAHLPAQLATPLTVLFGSVAGLQWLSIGRQRALRRAGGKSHASKLAMQTGAFALVEVTLYSIGVVHLASQGGLDLSRGLGLVAAIGGAAIFALANIWVKFNSVDTVERDQDGVDISIEPPPATRSADNVHWLTQPDRDVAGYSQERHGLRAILASAELERQTERAALDARKDPITKRFIKASADQAQPKRRRKAA